MAKQTRSDWDESGDLWSKYQLLMSPDEQIYRSIIMEEEDERRLQQSSYLAGGDLDIQRDYDATFRDALQRHTENTQKLLNNDHQTREDWRQSSPKYHLWQCKDIVQELDSVYKDILTNVASRSVETRAIYSRVSGQKEVNALKRSLQQRYTQLGPLVKRFNTIAERLPEDYKILQLKEESFHDNKADPSSEEMLGPLWSFENLRMTVNSGLTESDPLRSTTPLYMDAVSLGLGIRRAQEEVDLINSRSEVSRLMIPMYNSLFSLTLSRGTVLEPLQAVLPISKQLNE